VTEIAPSPSSIGSRFDWRVFAVGMALLLVATVAALPFVHTLQILAQGEAGPAELAIFCAQALLEGAIALGLGLYLGGRIELGFALIPRWLRREPAGRLSLHVLQLAIVVAILGAVGVIILGTAVILVALAFGMDPETIADMGSSLALFESYPAPWKWLLISLHAGIAEEIFFRLGLLTMLAWLGSLLWRNAEGQPAQAVFWGANLLAGLAFGVAHLFGGMPYPEIPVIMARIVVQNTAIGLVFGWLYRRWGLESAMLAHLTVDVVFYVILVPSLQSQSVVWMLSALAGLAIALIWAWHGLRTRARNGYSVALTGPSPDTTGVQPYR
jgi:membrane protease YdiL (CAAX protease family)